MATLPAWNDPNGFLVTLRSTHYEKGARAFEGARKLAIPSRGILADRSSPSRVRFAAKNALLTAAAALHISPLRRNGGLRNGDPVVAGSVGDSKSLTRFCKL